MNTEKKTEWIVNGIVDLAKTWLKKNGSVPLALVINTDDGETRIYSILPEKPSDTDTLIRIIPGLLGIWNSGFYAAISETWISSYKRGEKRIEPRLNPKRKDGLNIAYNWRNGQKKVVSYIVHKNKSLELHQEITGGEIGGRLFSGFNSNFNDIQKAGLPKDRREAVEKMALANANLDIVVITDSSL